MSILQNAKCERVICKKCAKMPNGNLWNNR